MRKSRGDRLLKEGDDDKIPPPKSKMIVVNIIGLVNIILNRGKEEENDLISQNIKKQLQMFLGTVAVTFVFVLFCISQFCIVEIAGTICILYTFDSWIHIIMGVIALFIAIVLYCLFKKD